jgi:predicted 3-demethylubiquinone-9 3-methyltransferase (glyoxalase superfamily)
MATVQPFLMFQQGEAEQAMRFYVSLFADGVVLELERWGAGERGTPGTVKRGAFRVAGQAVRVFDSPVRHAFGFTPAVSLFVDCDSDAQIEKLHAALVEGGSALMPLGSYGFSRRFAWLNDRYGLSWQLNLP